MGVSIDSQETNDRFAKSLELPYLLVGDPDGEILRAYQVSWPIVGLARRVSYRVGRDRRVETAYHSELDAESHVAEACAFVARPRVS